MGKEGERERRKSGRSRLFVHHATRPLANHSLSHSGLFYSPSFMQFHVWKKARNRGNSRMKKAFCIFVLLRVMHTIAVKGLFARSRVPLANCIHCRYVESDAFGALLGIHEIASVFCPYLFTSKWTKNTRIESLKFQSIPNCKKNPCCTLVLKPIWS